VCQRIEAFLHAVTGFGFHIINHLASPELSLTSPFARPAPLPEPMRERANSPLMNTSNLSATRNETSQSYTLIINIKGLELIACRHIYLPTTHCRKFRG
jgi:hypothetical protein